ncbi:helix-turn-helix domain-containing protein [Microbacterium sp. PAMC21962]|uniref:Lsr2 family DNA-binding protein n=1 Tax=Microbacterium sp. PAMC21962 TaxID=2861280 RepID=UPI001C628D53|nr:helix-turn-helix domain-containing protein [Microbacterium sp. PAMC21962]QYF98474.1 helix-turn-helix domain-containing protein [Microbacterium sp. PAMC21962]
MGDLKVSEPAWMWSDASIRAEDAATVRAGVSSRFKGDERDQILGMLLGSTQPTIPAAISKLRQGDKLPDEAKAQILALVATGMSDAEIADQLGVSRQAVTGVRSHAQKRAARTATREETTMETPTKTQTEAAPIRKPKRGPKIAPTASGRTKAELAEIRQWAKDNGVPHTVTGRMPRATIAAYDAAHAASEARADDGAKLTPPRKLEPMKPVEQPAALKEPAAHELAGVAEAIQVAIVHGAVAPDMETRAELFNEGWEAAEESYGPVVDDLLRTEASLEFVLQKWGEESRRRRAQSALLRSMARQVILAEQERRDDAELLAAMDTALAEAYERIAQLTAELAARPEPWWKRFAS